MTSHKAIHTHIYINISSAAPSHLRRELAERRALRLLGHGVGQDRWGVGGVRRVHVEVREGTILQQEHAQKWA